MSETDFRKKIIETCLDYREFLEKELKQANKDGITGTYDTTRMLMEVNDLIADQSKHFIGHEDKLVTGEELDSDRLTLAKEDTMNFKRR